MPYTINLSNGTPLITIADGVLLGPLDPNAPSNCSLNLIGRNSVNYGLSTNTDFVWLTENFAAATAPVSPLIGQLWYNTATSTLMLQNTSNDWVEIYSSDNPINLMEDITVYDGHGDSSTLGANGIITLIRADYKPRIIFEGIAHAANAAVLQLGTDSFGNTDLTLSSNAGTGFLWHSANLSPFDLNKNNRTANVISNFYGSMFLNDKALVTIDELNADLAGYLPLAGGTMTGKLHADAGFTGNVGGSFLVTLTKNGYEVLTTADIPGLPFLPLSGGTMTGLIDASASGMTSLTYATSDNSIRVATTNFVHNLLNESYLPLAGGTMTGPVALDGATTPTLPITDNSINVATTQFVHEAIAAADVPAPSTIVPLIEGSASIGTSTQYARADHVHPASGGGGGGGGGTTPTGFGALYTYTYAYYILPLNGSDVYLEPTVPNGSIIDGSTFVIPYYDLGSGITTNIPAPMTGQWTLMSVAVISAQGNADPGQGGTPVQFDWLVQGLFQRTA